jgi:hypothetical protein
MMFNAIIPDNARTAFVIMYGVMAAVMPALPVLYNVSRVNMAIAPITSTINIMTLIAHRTSDACASRSLSLSA